MTKKCLQEESETPIPKKSNTYIVLFEVLLSISGIINVALILTVIYLIYKLCTVKKGFNGIQGSSFRQADEEPRNVSQQDGKPAKSEDFDALPASSSGNTIDTPLIDGCDGGEDTGDGGDYGDNHFDEDASDNEVKNEKEAASSYLETSFINTADK